MAKSKSQRKERAKESDTRVHWILKLNGVGTAVKTFKFAELFDPILKYFETDR